MNLRIRTSYFNPRSPWGERPTSITTLSSLLLFQSTLPVGGATPLSGSNLRRSIFQSTLPVGGATFCAGRCRAGRRISIHAPRGGSDRADLQRVLSRRISIHAPRGGSDQRKVHKPGVHYDFNPRSPWGERLCAHLQRVFPRHFNPRSPWGERLLIYHLTLFLRVFQSTLPVGGATAKMHKFPAASLAKVSNFVGQAPGKAVPNRFKSRYSPHRFTKKPCEPPGNSCSPELRTTGSGYPPADRCSCSRNAQPFFHIDSPGSRSGGCPFPDP